MNFFHFASLMLMFSLTVLASPQVDLFGNGTEIVGSDNDQEIIEHSGPDKNPRFIQIDTNAPENRDLLTMLFHKMQPLLDIDGSCSYKLNRVRCAKQKYDKGIKTKMVMEVCPNQCSPSAAKVNTKCKNCQVKVHVSPYDSILRIDKLVCEEKYEC